MNINDATEQAYKNGYNTAIQNFAERLNEELKPTFSTLFHIGEILVDVSKYNISPEDAIDTIRDKLHWNKDVIQSHLQADKMFNNLIKELTK